MKVPNLACHQIEIAQEIKPNVCALSTLCSKRVLMKSLATEKISRNVKLAKRVRVAVFFALCAVNFQQVYKFNSQLVDLVTHLNRWNNGFRRFAAGPNHLTLNEGHQCG